MQKKCVVIILLVAFVILLSAYFIFSPGKSQTSVSSDYNEMKEAVDRYNIKFNENAALYSSLIEHSNNMTADRMLTLEEIKIYETKLRKFITASDEMMKESENIKQTVEKFRDNFLQSDYERIISELNAKEDAMRISINNVIIGINMIRGQNKSPEYDKILNDLSVELIEIRDR